MKKTFLILVTLLFIQFKSQNFSNLYVQYDYNSNGIYYPTELYFEDEIARFTIYYSKVNEILPTKDSLLTKNEDCLTCQNKLNLVFKSDDAVFYKLKNIHYSTFKSIQNTFNIKEDNLMTNWELGKDRKILLGYNCQNAFIEYKGRKYEVYFTSEIPISEGPWKFNGLSGLILEIHSLDGLYSFVANKIRINDEKRINIKVEFQTFSSNKNYISWSEYYKIANQKLIDRNKKIQSDSDDKFPPISIIGETIENVFNDTSLKIKSDYEKKYGVIK